jgi:hypothetical protein
MLTIVAGIVVWIDRHALFKKLRSRQSLVYIALLCTSWALAFLYLSDMDIPSPIQALEAFLEPVGFWLWG